MKVDRAKHETDLPVPVFWITAFLLSKIAK